MEENILELKEITKKISRCDRTEPGDTSWVEKGEIHALVGGEWGGEIYLD